MMTNLRKYILVIVMQLAITYSLPVLSVSTDVLDIDEITSSDINILVEDTMVFNTIGMGIALSIAQCDGKDICDPTVNENEIGQLIEALDRRIESVVTRQQNNEEDMSNIVTAYVDTREKYTGYMERLSKITRSPITQPAEDEFLAEDIFADEEAMTEDEYSAFSDFEDSLEDDEDLVDDEDLEEFEEDSSSEEL